MEMLWVSNFFPFYCITTLIYFKLDLLLSSSKISSFSLLPNKLYPASCLMNVISAVFSLLIFLCFNAQISQPCKSDGIIKIFYTFHRYWTNGSKFRILYISKYFVVFEFMSYPLHLKQNVYMNVVTHSNIAVHIVVLYPTVFCP